MTVTAPVWTPVYLTDDERAFIAARLILAAETYREAGNEAKAKESYWHAGLITFATSPELRT